MKAAWQGHRKEADLIIKPGEDEQEEETTVFLIPIMCQAPCLKHHSCYLNSILTATL